ncbi:outer membrane protein assembly factor BamD [Photobacterium aphoticum]|uniref:Outer membrane protein assembly factor BamD n=1 Tax=Photobacterium aphoticum TaxID=754436 RepID=A0A090R3M8_9GAMM|nr:outer membrane protein assembly factor BamD [Photobacterium aphoticum]KLU99029.1 membrane protein [Photobacterium aphoticum]PSU55644.1 outer membrane protein assembly factor BamD [Photobacterium aphoticum]GAL08734.1 probable component of the lipoprotein assembly complex [Photobacterium aphoticum]GHA57521.1 outer membrane protein assembly factor BamD [Photobacterium aphoticum]
MKRLTLTALLAVTLLSGCSTTEEVVPDVPPSELYATAQQALQNGSWTTAIERLETLDSRYPFGAYSEQVQLDLIYAYYKNDDLALGEATIDRFNRLNPAHEKADWVLYMRGLTRMAQDRSFMHDLFNIDRHDRDPEPARKAFHDFKRLLERYPNSRYAADAQARMVFLKNRLADYELATTDFYIRRGAWVAAINRAQLIQDEFADTHAARESLKLMAKAYEELGLETPLDNTRQLMTLNPL